MATPSILKTIEIDHPPIYYRAECVHVAVAHGKVEILSIGQIQFRTHPRAPWKDHTFFSEDATKAFRQDLWEKLQPDAYKIEAEIRAAHIANESFPDRCNRIVSENTLSAHLLRQKHRPDCALYGDNDFGSTNHCTCKGDEARHERTA